MNSSCKSIGALSASKIEEGKFVPLGDLVRMVSGGTPSKNNPNYWIGSIPWVSAKDMKSFFISDSQDHVSESAVKAGARMVPEGTVLLLTRGMTLLKDVPICVARTSLTFNQDVKALLAQSSLASDYLPYLLLGNKSRLLGLVDLAGHGTGRLNSDSLRALEVWLPPLPEQRAIASVLGALDDKIDLNRRMCQTLEEMARALFKSWFVDFDPVRAKMEGRDPGLPKEIADLFPSRLVDSELGPIPEGWRRGTADCVSELNPESWSAKSRPSVVRYVDLAAAKWGQLDEAQELSGKAIPSRAQRILRVGDSIVGTVRPGNGSYGLISDGGLTGSTGFAVLRPRKPHCRTYVYFAATSQPNIERLSRLADGGAYPAVRPDVVAATPCVIPPEELLSRLEDSAGALLDRAAHSERESRTLAALRDTLLPKLISGELRVPASLGSMQEVAT
jgi:type I restriction enzyme S subunit